MMNLHDFYYDLPKELIAQDPLADRASSKLLVTDRYTGELCHDIFQNITRYLKPGDCLVLNDTKVIPARLFGTRADTGATVEILLLTRKSDTDWECIVKPGKKCRTGHRFFFGEQKAGAQGTDAQKDEVQGADEQKAGAQGADAQKDEVQGAGEQKAGAQGADAQKDEIQKADAQGAPLDAPCLEGEIIEVKEDGNRIIRFSYDGIFEEILDALGQMPLPPYITHQLKDKNRYQTVYARHDGSAAAPTAGLHFTNELLDEIQKMGVTIARVTLHVGLGTFRPVKEENILDHKMHSEYYVITEEAAEQINRAKKEGGRIICVGTTSTRTLESAAAEDGTLKASSGWTDIFIYPGYRFKITDCLITNFHLPESTLVMLVSAFSSREIILHAYEEAIRERYRFFSFGDAMFLTTLSPEEPPRT